MRLTTLVKIEHTAHDISSTAVNIGEDVNYLAHNAVEDVQDLMEDKTKKVVKGVRHSVSYLTHQGETVKHVLVGIKGEENHGETKAEKTARMENARENVKRQNLNTGIEFVAAKRDSASGAAASRRKLMFSEADVEASAKEASEDMFMHGSASLYKTKTAEMGEMGIGIQLYFEISKVLAISFLLMFLCHVPTMYLNSAGNNGHALTPDLQGAFASLSLANQGFSWDTVEEPDCIANGGDVDCTGLTVSIFGTTRNAEDVSNTIMVCEFIAGIVFIGTCAYCIFITEKVRDASRVARSKV